MIYSRVNFFSFKAVGFNISFTDFVNIFNFFYFASIIAKLEGGRFNCVCKGRKIHYLISRLLHDCVNALCNLSKKKRLVTTKKKKEIFKRSLMASHFHSYHMAISEQLSPTSDENEIKRLSKLTLIDVEILMDGRFSDYAK